MNPGTRVLLPVLLILAVGLSACGGDDGPSDVLSEVVTTITVQLNWTHQAEFAGSYAADQNGYYAAEGLTVALVEGGPNIDRIGRVLEGEAQIGILNGERLVAARADGEPVLAIAAVYARTPAVYIAMADSGIHGPEDFVGKTIEALPCGRVRLHAVAGRVGVGPDEYTVVDMSPDLEALYSGKVDVRSGWVINEVLQAEAAGHEITLVFPDDYGVHTYADVIFTTDEFAAEDPDAVTRFLRATLQGWKYAVENPEAMGAMVLEYDPGADAGLETAKMVASVPLVFTGEDPIGWMRREVWEGIGRILREQDVLTDAVDVSEVYTMQFLEDIYGSGE